MSLSVSDSYKGLGTYAEPSMNVVLLNLSIENYVDSRVSNKDLALILKGSGKSVDTSSFPTSFVRLFADELKAYNRQFRDSHVNVKKDSAVFQASIRHYMHFIKANFSDILFFEAIIICMTKYAGIIQIVPHCSDEVDLFSASFNKYKHLYSTTYKEYSVL
jgi:hypothetical protein